MYLISYKRHFVVWCLNNLPWYLSLIHIITYLISQIDAGWEEYYDYIFPEDEESQPNLKLLAMAKMWKDKKNDDSSDSNSSDDNDEDSEDEEAETW